MVALHCPAFVLGSFLSASGHLSLEVENRTHVAYVADRAQVDIARRLSSRLILVAHIVEMAQALPPMATVMLPIPLPQDERAVGPVGRLWCHRADMRSACTPGPRKCATMPRKRHLEAAAATSAPAVPSFASQMLAAGADAMPSRRPEAVAGAPVRERAQAAQPPRDSLQAITARLGARWWATNYRFDWARDAATRHRYEFTRYYFEQRVIVDVWESGNPGTKRDVARKKTCVDVENIARATRGEAPIGYLPVVRGAIIADEAFDRVLRGETLGLIERAPEGVLI